MKLVRDVAPAHQLQFALTVGPVPPRSGCGIVGRDEVKDGVNDAGVAVLTWRYLVSPRFMLTQRLAADANAFRNVNRDGVELHQRAAGM